MQHPIDVVAPGVAGRTEYYVFQLHAISQVLDFYISNNFFDWSQELL